AALPAERYQADIAEHLQMLRDRRLRHLELVDDVAHGAFVTGEKHENVAAPRFGDGVERIGRRRGAGHGLLYIPLWEYVKSRSGSRRRYGSARDRRPTRTASGRRSPSSAPRSDG